MRWWWWGTHTITCRGGGFGTKSKNQPVRAHFQVHCWKWMVGVMAGVGGVWEMRWLCQLGHLFNNLCSS
jgi:hypothetical protein